MNRLIKGFMIILISLSWGGVASSSQMVDRNIFSPERDRVGKTDKKAVAESPEIKQLKKKLDFTGVVIAPKTKYAMIRDRTVKRDDQGSILHLEGDEVGGMTITEIGSNYLLLSGKAGELRLGLYEGDKSRPAPPPEPKPEPETVEPEAAPEKGDATEAKKPSARGTGKESPAVIKPPAKKGAKGKTDSGAKKPSAAAASGGSNPFLDAMKKARERQAEGTSQPSTGSNPFLDALKRSQGN